MALGYDSWTESHYVLVYGAFAVAYPAAGVLFTNEFLWVNFPLPPFICPTSHSGHLDSNSMPGIDLPSLPVPGLIKVNHGMVHLI